MYTDMTERAVYKWQLDYSMPMIIKDFEAIPADKLGWRPAAKTRSAGQIFGHLIATERAHVRGFVQGIPDLGKDAKVFRSLTFCDPGANSGIFRPLNPGLKRPPNPERSRPPNPG